MIGVLFALLASGAAPAAPDDPNGRLRGDWPSTPSGVRVSIEAKSANDALRQLATAARWNLVLDAPEAGQRPVEISIHEAAAEEALVGILEAGHLSAKRVGQTLVVSAGAEAQDSAESDDDEPPAPPPTPLPHTRALWHHGHHGRGDRVSFGNVALGADERAGNVVAIGGSVTLAPGAHARSAVAVGGQIALASGATVDESAVSVGGNIDLADGARVVGDAVSVGGKVLTAGSASVGRDQTELFDLHQLLALGLLGGLGFGLLSPFFLLGSAIARFVLFFLIAALLLAVAPVHLERLGRQLRSRWLLAGVTGFVGTLAIPVLTVLLIVTLIGIPLLAVEFFALLLAWAMGFSALALLLGRQLPLRAPRGDLVSLAFGVAVIVLVSAVPWIGTLATVTGWFVIFGAVLLTRFGSHGAPAGRDDLAPLVG